MIHMTNRVCKSLSLECGATVPRFIDELPRSKIGELSWLARITGYRLAPTMCNSDGIRIAAEHLHPDDPYERPGSQRGKRPIPPEVYRYPRDQINANKRNSKASRHLKGQRSARYCGVAQLSDSSRELSGVSDDGGAPNEADDKR